MDKLNTPRSISYRQPIFNAPPATAAICIALLAINLVMSLVPGDLRHWLEFYFALIPSDFYAQFADRGPGLVPRQIMTLVSYALLHGGWLHVLINTAMLLAFGSVVERAIGPRWFLGFFAASAIGGAAGQLLLGGPQIVLVLGASGAAYGAIGGAVPLMFRRGLPSSRQNALIFVAVIMGLNLVFGFFGAGLFGGAGGIAWQAHIGGFVTGLALMLLWRRH